MTTKKKKKYGKKLHVLQIFQKLQQPITSHFSCNLHGLQQALNSGLMSAGRQLLGAGRSSEGHQPGLPEAQRGVIAPLGHQRVLCEQPCCLGQLSPPGGACLLSICSNQYPALPHPPSFPQPPLAPTPASGHRNSCLHSPWLGLCALSNSRAIPAPARGHSSVTFSGFSASTHPLTPVLPEVCLQWVGLTQPADRSRDASESTV